MKPANCKNSCLAVWNQFRTHTSSHGIPQASRSRGSIRRSFWIVITLGCLGFLLYHVITLTMRFTSYKVDVVVELAQSRELEFPAVTVCNMNPIRMSAVSKVPQLGELLETEEPKVRRKRAAPTTAPPDVCEEKAYLVYPENGTGICFWVPDVLSLDYNGAGTTCQSLGGHLAVLDTTYKMSHVSTFMEYSTRHWFGLRRNAGDEWEWMQQFAMTWAMWGLPSPKTDSAYICGYIYQHKWFNQYLCSSGYKALCERPIDGIVPIPAPTVAGTCPEVPYPVDANCNLGICYWTPDNYLRSYNESETLCESQGGQVAVVDTRDKHNYLMTILNIALRYWMGLTRNAADQWLWQGQDPITWSNWGSFQPRSYSGHECAYYYDQDWYNSYPCNDLHLVLCEKPTGGCTTPSPTVEMVSTTDATTTSVTTTTSPTTLPHTTTSSITTTDFVTTMEHTSTASAVTTTPSATSIVPTTAPSPVTTEQTTAPPPVTTEQTTAPPPVTTEQTSARQPVTTDPTTAPPPVTTEPTTAPPPVTTEPSTAIITLPSTSTTQTTTEPNINTITTTQDQIKTTSSERPAAISTESQDGGVESLDMEPRPTEEFLKREKVLDTLNNVPEDIKQIIGHQRKEFLVRCVFGAYACNMSTIQNIYDPVLGNCYIYNSGWMKDQEVIISHRTGRRYGLKFIINIQQHEYVEHLGESAGVRVLVLPQREMPFPQDEGIMAEPGKLTSIGVKLVGVNRLPHPYGNCISNTSTNRTRSIYEATYPVHYTSTACMKSCYQTHLIELCHCVDPQTLSTGDYPTCLTGSIEDQCRKEVEKKYNKNQLKCDCPNPCVEKKYSLEVSSNVWPSTVHEGILNNMVESLELDERERVLYNDTAMLRLNFLKLEVFYEDFDHEIISEKPAYSAEIFISDLGGILGLWVGCSIVSVFEFVELFVDLIVLRMYICRPKSKVQAEKTCKEPTVKTTDRPQPITNGRILHNLGEYENSWFPNQLTSKSIRAANSPRTIYRQ